MGRESLQELRLRIGKPPELVLFREEKRLLHSVCSEDLSYVINMASRYSPWSATSAAMGYITACGGHRIGLCGEVLVKDGMVTGMRKVTSLCIRVARDFTAIAAEAAKQNGNLLILGPPGSGKTTFLRDLIRQKSQRGLGSVAVVDERGELFPMGFDSGMRTDILSGCSKSQGIPMALRTMGPSCIAVDEISQREDCQALLECGWCGVELLATAHASNVKDLASRGVYRPLWECGLFSQCVVLQRDKSWHWERIGL